jgi:hypothetical protein
MRAIFACIVGLLAGCSSSSPARPMHHEDAGVHGGLPCDVELLLGARCAGCHSAHPENAPMPLVGYDDLLAPSKSDPSRRVVDVALERITAGSMPPGGALGDEDVAPLRAWIASGAPPTICIRPDGGSAKTAPPAGPECSVTSECPGSLVCKNRLCDVECATDADCAPGIACEETRCRSIY